MVTGAVYEKLGLEMPCMGDMMAEEEEEACDEDMAEEEVVAMRDCDEEAVAIYPRRTKTKTTECTQIEFIL